MHLTRRSREFLAVSAVCLLIGFLSGESLWVYLAVPLVALFLSWQLHAAIAFRDTARDLTIQYESLEESVTVSEPVICRVRVAAPTPHPSVEVTIPRPVAAETPGEPQTCSLDVATAEEVVTFETEFAVAGSHTLPAPKVTLTDSYGMVTETIPTEESSSVTVLPAVPRNVHVGQGGSEIAAFGQHETGQRGSGIQPAELRQYQPGDATRHIDWKATARLNAPYVREFEAETDRQTIILLDGRASMGAGTEGQTMFAFGREVAASIAAVAREFDDPLGAYLLLDDHLQAHPPANTPQQYRSIRQRLLQAREPSDPVVSNPPVGPTVTRSKLLARLSGDDSTLARTVSPFLRVGSSIRTTEETTLTAATDRIGLQTTGEHWSVVITSDVERTDVRAAVQRAQSASAAVSVFLTPSVLFETGSLGDLESAYERYVDFEEFRRSLSQHPDVEAYTVAPGDRLHSLLASQRPAERW